MQKKSDKGLFPKITQKSLELNNKKMNNSIKKWAKDLNRYLTNKNKHMVNEHMKKYSTLYVIRKLQQIKTIRYYYKPTRTAKIQNTDSKC